MSEDNSINVGKQFTAKVIPKPVKIVKFENGQYTVELLPGHTRKYEPNYFHKTFEPLVQTGAQPTTAAVASEKKD